MRICSECNKKMTEGYCINGGVEYYCSDECLHKHYTEEEWLDMYEDGGDSYWTDWEYKDEEVVWYDQKTLEDSPKVYSVIIQKRKKNNEYL